ncbi:HTH-type transcriptional regulator Mce2R [Actinoplanes sp. OR16]|uniref:FadR/GntR family transcriptional regulator n=1 Tax=Actinoplanes sp. OR16 TaxID=946334 RepID=UPI000F6D5712|nr:GntR family transcriptional regulator [Actinoplanes sp. OR16]BBH70331.1 HTH-type transcriptional regulator Mce2R [Actinoplanes sp. OR16]
MTFDPAPRQSVSDHVFGRLRDAVVRGRYAPGDALPSERDLAATFEVNRHAVREALRRLQQLGLVKVSQGGATRVLDWRSNAGLDLALGAGQDVLPVATLGRDVMEMRACIGADAARLSAVRADATGRQSIAAAVDDYAAAVPDLAAMAQADLAFWRRIVEASGNIAYLLAFNSLTGGELAVVRMPADERTSELLDVAAHRALAELIAAGDAAGAERAARALLAAPTPAKEIGNPR